MAQRLSQQTLNPPTSFPGRPARPGAAPLATWVPEPLPTRAQQWAPSLQPRALHPPLCPLPSSTLARQLVEGRVLAPLRKRPDPDVFPHAELCPLLPSSQGRAGVSAPRRSENLQASQRESEAPRGPTAWPRFLLTLRRSSHPPQQELVPQQPASPAWPSLGESHFCPRITRGPCPGGSRGAGFSPGSRVLTLPQAGPALLHQLSHL